MPAKLTTIKSISSNISNCIPRSIPAGFSTTLDVPTGKASIMGKVEVLNGSNAFLSVVIQLNSLVNSCRRAELNRIPLPSNGTRDNLRRYLLGVNFVQVVENFGKVVSQTKTSVAIMPHDDFYKVVKAFMESFAQSYNN